MTLGWVIVYVDEPAQAAAFYDRTFGMSVEFSSPDGDYAQLATGTTRLAFASYALGEHNFAGGVRRAPLDGQPPNVELALVHEDVDTAFARALEAGCAGLSEPHDEPRGQRVGYVRDPFGTLVELASRCSRSRRSLRGGLVRNVNPRHVLRHTPSSARIRRGEAHRRAEGPSAPRGAAD
jgi:lactoylglutathione lyase